jgi:hypothetical protein
LGTLRHTVGATVGLLNGAFVGCFAGLLVVGFTVCEFIGDVEGLFVGDLVGVEEGLFVGAPCKVKCNKIMFRYKPQETKLISVTCKHIHLPVPVTGERVGDIEVLLVGDLVGLSVGLIVGAARNLKCNKIEFRYKKPTRQSTRHQRASYIHLPVPIIGDDVGDFDGFLVGLADSGDLVGLGVGLFVGAARSLI